MFMNFCVLLTSRSGAFFMGLAGGRIANAIDRASQIGTRFGLIRPVKPMRIGVRR